MKLRTQYKNWLYFLLIAALIIILISLIIFFIPEQSISIAILISPYFILLINYIVSQKKEERKSSKEKLALEKNIQHFFNNFIKWISKGQYFAKNQFNYAENYILKNFPKFEKYFGLAILETKELSAEERGRIAAAEEISGEYHHKYSIYILEGSYIIEYYIGSFSPYDYEIDIEIKETSHQKEKEKTPVKMIKEISDKMIKYVKDNFDFDLKKPPFLNRINYNKGKNL
ncbi:MAG: hypothetical protein KGD63_15700 [Candidatus Lokiarchaeota archaeon]|nr:hypothetical protein [Candidatus Lokiarchaeota archaeon]